MVDRTAKPGRAFSVTPPFREGQSARPLAVGCGSQPADGATVDGNMKAKHLKVPRLLFQRPVWGGIRWDDIEALFLVLGAEITEAEGSRICVRLFGDRRVFHRPHPTPDTDKGAVVSIRKWLEENGVKP